MYSQRESASDNTMISVLSRYCPYSDAEFSGGFPHFLPCLKVQWLIAARSGEEADIGGNGMVVMLFLKQPAERRDEASLSWCWHHLIIRSDVNLRLHSIHTDAHAGTTVCTHTLQILQQIISAPKWSENYPISPIKLHLNLRVLSQKWNNEPTATGLNVFFAQDF